MTCENCNDLTRCERDHLFNTTVNDHCPKCAVMEDQ